MENDVALEMRRRNQVFGNDDQFDESRHTGGIVPSSSENGKHYLQSVS